MLPKNDVEETAFLASPKSASLMCPSLSNKVFDAFKSLYKILFLCNS